MLKSLVWEAGPIGLWGVDVSVEHPIVHCRQIFSIAGGQDPLRMSEIAQKLPPQQLLGIWLLRCGTGTHTNSMFLSSIPMVKNVQGALINHKFDS